MRIAARWIIRRKERLVMKKGVQGKGQELYDFVFQ
jgi:hypothetical protein